MIDESESEGQGGETSCYAHLLCSECGVVLDGSDHAPTCSRLVAPPSAVGDDHQA